MANRNCAFGYWGRIFVILTLGIMNSESKNEVDLTRFAATLPTSIKPNTPFSMNFEMDIKNIDANNIAEKTYNWDPKLYFSQFDLRAVIATGAREEISLPATLFADVEKEVGIAAGATYVIPAKSLYGVTLSAAFCKTANWLCAFTGQPGGKAWSDNDKDLADNYNCQDISSLISCGTTIGLPDFTLPTVIKQGIQTTDSSLVAQVNNTSPNSQGDIKAVTGTNFNFAWTFGLYTSDTMNTANLVPGTTTYTPTIDISERQKALAAQSTLAQPGSAIYPILSVVQCNSFTHICYRVKSGTGADFTDTTGASLCKSITAIKQCEIDIECTSATYTGGGSVYVMNTAKSVTGISVNARNNGASNIANTGTDNFIVYMFLSPVDYSAGATHPSVTKSTVGSLGTQLQQQSNGGSNTPTFTGGTASVTLPTTDCNTFQWMCYQVAPVTTVWVDTNPNNNYCCSNYLQSNLKCPPTFIDLPYNVSIPEDQAAGPIHTLSATLRDTGPLSYIITGQTPGAKFEITNTDKLSIKTGQTFNYETGPNTYTLNVQVTDGDGNTDTGVVTVFITDVNEAPVITNIPPTNLVITKDENFVGDILQITATNPESVNGQTLSYAISQNVGAANTFTIDSSTGLIKVASSPGLNYEAFPSYTLTVTVTDVGNPTPNLAATYNFTFDVTNADEPPVIHNLPDTVAVLENSTGNVVILTLNITDEDTALAALKKYISCSPSTDQFELVGNDIKIKANPNFNYESNMKQFKCAVIVSDESSGLFTNKNFKYLTIDIVNVREPPYFTNLPWNITVPENHVHEMQLYQVEWVDPENQILTVNWTIVPTSGNDKFFLYTATQQHPFRQKGRIDLNPGLTPPGINYEADLKYYVDGVWGYIANVTICTTFGCNWANLTIHVEDVNEKPTWGPPNDAEITIAETKTGNIFALAGLCHDPDTYSSDTLSYSIRGIPSYANGAFSISGTDVTTTGYDYDCATCATVIILDIRCLDSRGLHADFKLKINVLNVNDNTPTFNPNPYTATIPENSAPSTSIITVTATDADASPYGTITFYVDSSSPNASAAFELEKISDTTAVLKVKGPLDIEQWKVYSFNIIADDSNGRKGTAQVTITLTNVNDVRPVFEPSFYNAEVSTTAAIGKSVIQITATDGDVEYKVIKYEQLYINPVNEFAIASTTGSVTTTTTPLRIYYEYRIYATATDNDPVKTDTSIPATIRIDTYVNEDVLICFNSTKPPSFFDSTQKADFIQKVSAICPPCVGRIHDVITNDIGGSLIRKYFLKDSSSDSISNINVPKEFHNASTFVETFRINSEGKPISAIWENQNFANFPVVKVKACYTVEVPRDDGLIWILVGIGMAISYGIYQTIVTCLARVLFRKQTNDDYDNPKDNDKSQPRHSYANNGAAAGAAGAGAGHHFAVPSERYRNEVAKPGSANGSVKSVGLLSRDSSGVSRRDIKLYDEVGSWRNA